MDYYDDYLDDVKKSREERITKMLNEFYEIKKENKKLKEQLALCNVVVPKGTLCETCQDKGQYYAGTLIGYVNCPDCND